MEPYCKFQCRNESAADMWQDYNIADAGSAQRVLLMALEVYGRIMMGRACITAASVFFLIVAAQASTNNEDIYALNELYVALGSPPLNGWKASGGDPCLENWQGVACAGPNVTLLNLAGLSLTGGLGTALENFTTLIVLDVSNNQVSGGLPSQLPPHAQQLILSANHFSGDLPQSLAGLNDLAILNVSGNSLSGNLPDVFDQSDTLTTLDISNNQFIGQLPASIGNLRSLNELYLQNNLFSGKIDVLAKLPLKVLDISGNKFTGWIPSELKSIPSLQLAGNFFNTSAPPPPPPFSTSEPAVGQAPTNKQTRLGGGFLNIGRLVGIIVATLLAAVVAALVVLFFVFKSRDRQMEEKDRREVFWQGPFISPWKGEDEHKEISQSKLNDSPVLKPLAVDSYAVKSGDNASVAVPSRVANEKSVATVYTFTELDLATQNFDYKNLIGEGAHGEVYRGQLLNGKLVAVKRLDSSTVGANFSELVSRIARLDHTNITRFVGFCVDREKYFLLYDYIGNGTLHENLHSGLERSQHLSWNLRVNIALGVASALEYLHEVCVPASIHHKLTSVNILLDYSFTPHLSDCELAAHFFLNEKQQTSVNDREVSGYMPPECTTLSTYTSSSDVYSFGVVMLELLTGRQAYDSTRPKPERSLVRWAVPQLHDIDALAKMVDCSCKGACSKKAISRFVDVLSQCIQAEPEFRPAMSEVRQSLAQLLEQ